jgi:hypothetical protein
MGEEPPPQEAFHVQHSLSLSTYYRPSRKWSVARIETSLPGAFCCSRCGLHTITAAAGVIYRAAIWMKLDETGPVERKDVERAAKRWAHRSYRNASSHGPEQTDKEFRQTTCNWLRFAGRLVESDRVPASYQEEIDALCRYSEVERGLSPATIATVRQSVRKFFKYIRVRQLSDLKIADVDRCLVLLGKQGWTRHAPGWELQQDNFRLPYANLLKRGLIG